MLRCSFLVLRWVINGKVMSLPGTSNCYTRAKTLECSWVIPFLLKWDDSKETATDLGTIWFLVKQANWLLFVTLHELSSELSTRREWSGNTSEPSQVAVNSHSLPYVTTGICSGQAYFNSHGPSLWPKTLLSLGCLSRTYQLFSKTSDPICIGCLITEI